MNFDFLNNVTISPIAEVAKVKNNGKKAIERNPSNGASLRLFKDGAIYPSQQLVDKFNLEYNKEKSGNGFDVFSSTNWSQYPKDAENVVFISATPKENTRVDLFGSAREVNGELTSVMTQGSKTFGQDLITMLEETYSVTLFTDSKYVDLLLVEDVAINSGDAPMFIPKAVTKGVHAGTMTTERRENVTLYPLAIFSNNENSEVVNGEVEEPELVEEDAIA